MISRDANGKVRIVSLLTVKKDGRTFLFPQMVDITDIKDEQKIIDILLHREPEPIKEKSRIRQVFEKLYARFMG